ncbi:MAG: anti-sigma factor family protein, partial [Novipirellula sp. JB048]
MMSTLLNDDAPLDPDDELLVAYVDGELESGERSRLEDRLLAEEALRRRLQELQQGWDLLDEFPSTTPCEKLVESTLELVVADLTHDDAAPLRPRLATARFRWPLTLLLLSAMAGLVAAGSIHVVRAKHYQSQLEDLAIAENIDAYYYGHDLQLMRDLAANDAWTNMIAAMREIGELSPYNAMVATRETSQREAAIASLSAVERSQLDSRWKRFVGLPAQDQQRIRDTADAVRDHANAASMLETMQAYAAWRETLSNELRDQIESEDMEQRREAIERAIDQTQLAVSKRSGLQLSDDSIERIAFALHQILKQRVADGDPATTRSIARLSQFMDPKRAELITIGAIVFGHGGRAGMRNGRVGSDRGPAPGGRPRARPAPLT